MSSEIEAHAAALRVAQLNGEEARELAEWLVASEGRLEDAGWYKSEVADKYGYKRHQLSQADRCEIAAACLLIAAEYERLTPFEQWFQRKHTAAERERFTPRDIDMMRIGFTKYGTENQ